MDQSMFTYQKHAYDPAESARLLEETLFHNANGYLGVRACFEEGYPAGTASVRGQYINGFYEIIDMPQAEKLHGLPEQKQTILNIADTQSIGLFIQGEAFSLDAGTVLAYRRQLDMAGGYTVRQIKWRSPGGHEVSIDIRRMASFTRLSLFVIDYTVTPLNFDGEVRFISAHIGEVRNYADPNDPRVAAESKQYLFADVPVVEDGTSVICAHTGRSGLVACTAVHNGIVAGTPTVRSLDTRASSVAETITLQAQKGQPIRLIKASAFGDSLHHAAPQAHVRDVLADALATGMDALYAEQRTYLDAFWANSALTIDGDDALSQAIRYNQYQLLQSVGKDDASNITAKGLSGEGYEGHYFWDTEMFIQPFFLLTNPALVKNLIGYRYAILPKALENAKLLGHGQGALYPWRTINGDECSGYFPSGTAQYHISGDVAYSVVQYYLATGDLAFIREKGAAIVLEVARLWADMAVCVDGQYHLHDVTGPDEYTCIVNNNYYTNALAKYGLAWAVKFAVLLGADFPAGKQELALFTEISENMYLPYDERLGINPQDDSFLQKKPWDFANTPASDYPLLLHYHPLCLYRHQVCKQADTVMAHFILEDYQSAETMQKSFEYYEKITTHDSSLSTCVFSIVAARLGMAEKALAYFGESAKLDLFDTHHNTKDGIHTANMGGTYMAIVYGFAGLRIREQGLSLAPMLPERWNAYSFRLAYRDSRLEITVDESGCRCRLLSGSQVSLRLYGEEILVHKMEG